MIERARLARFLLPALLLSAALPASGQSIVASPRPESLAVTVYRAPGRSPGEGFNPRWLQGYALVSERRTISLPAGESQVRFEGVAGGIVPQSAIVTGFPDGIVERNRDAYLLSPATLLDRSLGRRVTIRRTSAATGETRELEAVIRTGAEGAVVLETAEGFEALRCTGLPETLVYDDVPAELSATPTLSVRVRAAQPVTATVTLSYIASGFDWQANYVAQLSQDGRRVDLFAWLTLASNDETSFPDADTQAVAGRVNRDPVPPQPREGGPLQLRCWPRGTTSDIPLEQWLRGAPPPPAPPAVGYVGEGEAIVVTGSRMRRASLDSNAPVAVVQAEQEDLGDLKLYRIPEPVTVAANGQKQVALLQREDVEVAIVYRARLVPGRPDRGVAVGRTLVTRNREAEGLGLPLPAGGLVLFDSFQGRPIMVGEGFVGDLAVGEDVEVSFGPVSNITARTELRREAERFRWYELIVTNDRAEPVRFEAEFDAEAADLGRASARLTRRDGRPLWTVTVPANGEARLRYRIAREEDD